MLEPKQHFPSLLPQKAYIAQWKLQPLYNPMMKTNETTYTNLIRIQHVHYT